MINYKMILSYDGSNYYGFQKQMKHPSIQAEVERVLQIIFSHKEIVVCASGRTDKGVHANNQVINFLIEKDITSKRIKQSFNSLVNKDLYCKSVEKVDLNFHSRYGAKSKEYVYVINNEAYNPTKRNYEYYVSKKLDLNLMRKATTKLLGMHDFKAFTVTDCKNPSVKVLTKIEIIEENGSIYLYFTGNGFLRYMVRTIVGLLIEIGLNKKSIDLIDLAFETNNRKYLGRMAVSNGLYLNKVFYD